MIIKNDFIELEFTGRIKDGQLFDTNIKEEAKKIDLNIKTRPLVICIGQGMILPALDEFLIGKDIAKYSVELGPEQAFGKRDFSLVKTIPLKVFIEQNVIPQPGMIFNFDNIFGKVAAVSGGRVIVDFNNPLAGKTVIYELNAKRKLTDEKEKVESLISFFLRKKLDFKLEDKKLIITSENKMKSFIELFKDKFKEILNLELEVKEIETKAGKLEKEIEEKKPEERVEEKETKPEAIVKDINN